MIALPPIRLRPTRFVPPSAPMKQKRVLIGTPLKGDLPKHYVATCIKLTHLNDPDVKFDWIMLDGPSVQVARSEIAAYALKHKFDELIFWDKDVHSVQEGKDNTASAIMRLVDHDADFVCGLYSSRGLQTHWHVNGIEGEEPDPKTGLQKVNRAAIGFSKIRMRVFEKVAKDNPEFTGVLIDPNHAPIVLQEFFPMALQGPNTPRERIAKIRGILKDDLPNKLERLEREAFLVYDQPSEHIGEDYWFCDLAKASGFDVMIDSFMVMSHTGTTDFPIPTPALMQCLSEPWRKEERDAIAAELLKKRNATK